MPFSGTRRVGGQWAREDGGGRRTFQLVRYRQAHGGPVRGPDWEGQAGRAVRRGKQSSRQNTHPRRTSSTDGRARRAPRGGSDPGVRSRGLLAVGRSVFLPTRRWFGSKTRTITGVVPWTGRPFRRPRASSPCSRSRMPTVGARRIRSRSSRPPRSAPSETPWRIRHSVASCSSRSGLESSLPGQRGVFRFTPTPILAEILPRPTGEANRLVGRPEQHLDRVRTAGDPEALSKARTRPQPGLRDHRTI